MSRADIPFVARRLRKTNLSFGELVYNHRHAWSPSSLITCLSWRHLVIRLGQTQEDPVFMHLNLWPLTSDVFFSVAALLAVISVSVFLATSCGFCSACADIKRGGGRGVRSFVSSYLTVWFCQLTCNKRSVFPFFSGFSLPPSRFCPPSQITTWLK